MAESNCAICKLHSGIDTKLEIMEKDVDKHDKRIQTVEKRGQAILITLVFTLVGVIVNIGLLLLRYKAIMPAP